MRIRIELVCPKIGTGGGFCESSKEHSAYIKDGEFLNYVRGF
jgi:hypothetical protein